MSAYESNTSSRREAGPSAEADIDDLCYEGGIQELLDHTSQYNPHQLKCIDETTGSVMGMIDEIEADLNEYGNVIHMRNSKRSNNQQQEIRPSSRQSTTTNHTTIGSSSSSHYEQIIQQGVIRNAVYASNNNNGAGAGGNCFAAEPSAIEIMLEKSSLSSPRSSCNSPKHNKAYHHHRRQISASSGTSTAYSSKTTSTSTPSGWRFGTSTTSSSSSSASHTSQQPETEEAAANTNNNKAEATETEETTAAAAPTTKMAQLERSMTPSTYTGTTMTSSNDDHAVKSPTRGRGGSSGPAAVALRTRRKFFRDRFMKNRGVATASKLIRSPILKSPTSSNNNKAVVTDDDKVARGDGEKTEENPSGNSMNLNRKPLKRSQQQQQSPYTDTTMQETVRSPACPGVVQHTENGKMAMGEEEEAEEACTPNANSDPANHHATRSPMMMIRRPRGRSRSRKLKTNDEEQQQQQQEQQQQNPTASPTEEDGNKRNRSRSRSKSRPRLLLPKLICGGKAVDEEYEQRRRSQQMLILAQNQEQFQNQCQVMNDDHGPDEDYHERAKEQLDDQAAEYANPKTTGNVTTAASPSTTHNNGNMQEQQLQENIKAVRVSQYQLSSTTRKGPETPLSPADHKLSTVLSVPRNVSHISELSLPNFNRVEESSMPADANNSNDDDGGEGNGEGPSSTKAGATLEEISQLLHQVELDLMNGKKVSRSELLQTLKSATQTLDDRVPAAIKEEEEEEEDSSGILASNQGGSTRQNKSFNEGMSVPGSAFSPLTTKAVIGREDSSSLSGLATRSAATGHKTKGRALADTDASGFWSGGDRDDDGNEDDNSDSDSLTSERTDFTKWLHEIDEGDVLNPTSTKESINYLLDLFNLSSRNKGGATHGDDDFDDHDYEDYDDEHSGSDIVTPTTSVLQGSNRGSMTSAAALASAMSPNAALKNLNWGELSPTSYEWWRKTMMPSSASSPSKPPGEQKEKSNSHRRKSGMSSNSHRKDEERRNKSTDRPVSRKIPRIAPPPLPPPSRQSTEDVLSVSSIESNQYDKAWASFGFDHYNEEANKPRRNDGSNSAPKRRSKSLGASGGGGRRNRTSKRAQQYHYLVAGHE